MSDMWAYENWPSGEPYNWGGAARGTHPQDNIDFHVDLGCGRVPKGRIGVDRYPAPGVAAIVDFDGFEPYADPPYDWRGPVTLAVAEEPGADIALEPGYHTMRARGLPFGTSSIKSIISHHAFEHVGEGFMNLMNECYRVLEPGGLLRVVVPLFPSTSAVEDPDHCRYFMAHDGGGGTFDAFCGTPGDTPQNCWLASFSVPYTTARFEKVHQTISPRVQQDLWWGPHDAREMRVSLIAMKDPTGVPA